MSSYGEIRETFKQVVPGRNFKYGSLIADSTSILNSQFLKSHVHVPYFYNQSSTYFASTPTHDVTSIPSGIGLMPSPNKNVSRKISTGQKEDLWHPMNRNMPHLHIPSNTGQLTENIVKGIYRQLAKTYLSSFTENIHRSVFVDILGRHSPSVTPPGAKVGIQSMLVQIIGRKIYLTDPHNVTRNQSKPFYRTRANEVIWLLSRMVREGRIKDTEFLLGVHDCVQTNNRPHSYAGPHFIESVPAFTIATCNFSNNIPFPVWEGKIPYRDGGFEDWDENMRKFALSDKTKWEDKIEKAVFRGKVRRSLYFRNESHGHDHCERVGRLRLKHLYEKHVAGDVLNVSVGGMCGGIYNRLQRLNVTQQHQFKYVIYVEGGCMWADRIKYQLFGPSMIIKQETACGQFFEPLLKPFTHYMPTDFFFSDLIDGIKWARSHDKEVKEIVKNANDFARNFLSLSGVEAYVQVLLQEYTALLQTTVIEREMGAIDVTDRQIASEVAHARK